MNLNEYLTNNKGEAGRLATRMQVTPPSVWEWARKRVPAERVLQLWEETGYEVSPFEMRPDLYPHGLVVFISTPSSFNKESLNND